MISHVACLIKLWKRAKMHMTSSFFFSNNFSTLPNDKIVGRSYLEAFAEEFKLRYELCSVMIGWNTFKKRGNCCISAFSSFLSMFFQSLPSSIGLAFLNPKPSNVPRFSETFSGSRSKTAGEMHKLRNWTGLSLTYKYFVQRIELLSLYKDKELELWLFDCSKNRYRENQILSVKFIFLTSLCMNFLTLSIWSKF